MSHLTKLVSGTIATLTLLAPLVSSAATASEIQPMLMGQQTIVSQLQSLVSLPPAGAVSISPTCYVYAEKAAVSVNDSIAVDWYSVNADYVKDAKGAKLATKGSAKVTSPTAGTYTYALTAISKTGSANCATTITIKPAASSTVAKVTDGSANATLTYNAQDPSKSYGTYTMKFDLTAIGGDVYLPRYASTTIGDPIAVVYAVMSSSTFNGAQGSVITSTADPTTAASISCVLATPRPSPRQ
jgi:hypothetical protein